MAVSTTDTFTGPLFANGVTIAFPFTFKALTAEEVAVELDNDGVRTTVSPLLYGVTLTENGGTVTFDTAPASGLSLYLISDPTFLQNVQFADQERFGADATNEVNDRGAVRDLKLKGNIDRAIKYAVGTVVQDITPVPGQFIAFDGDGQPISASGTGADNGLREDLAAPTGASLAAFLQSGVGSVARSVQAKLRDTVSVLDFGAVGDGAADDTAKITAALATGKNVIFPKGYTFKTSGGHSIITDNQRIIIDGKIQHAGVTPASLFLIDDYADGVTFSGSGVLDGAKSSFVAGNIGSAIQAYRASNLTVDGINFENFIDDGIKAFNCPNLVVTAATRFYNIHNIGIEIKSYANDPRTALPWVGAVEGPSGSIDGFFDKIDDGLHGAGNGCGVDFSPADNAPDIQSLRIRGRFRDCLRAVFAENNYTSTVDVKDIVIDGVIIQGNYRGAVTVETKDGIGLVGCKNVQIISPTIRNVGNFAPVGGSCAGIQISGSASTDIEIINPQIVDDTGATDRTDYGINIAASPTDIRIRGGTIGGASISPINISGTATNVRIENVKGASADHSWGQTKTLKFKLDNIPIGATTVLQLEGGTALEFALMGTAGRVVGVAAQINGVPGAGTISLAVTANGTAQAGLAIANGDWATVTGTRWAAKNQASTAGTPVTAGQKVAVSVTTDVAYTPNTLDITVEVIVDIGMKQ